jgi:hypothetical protein
MDIIEILGYCLVAASFTAALALVVIGVVKADAGE